MQRAETERPLLATRLYGNFSVDKIPRRIGSFVEYASMSGGVPLLIVDPHFPSLEATQGFSRGNKAQVIFSRERVVPPYEISPAEMINNGLRKAFLDGHKYFGIISSDLAVHIPDLVQEMGRRLDDDPELVTVGVAINGVHNQDVLSRVQEEGMEVLTPGNYATAFPNNAFSLHRIFPQVAGYTHEDFHFPELFEDQLGYITIDNTSVPLRYNEEIARLLRSIRVGRPLKTLLLAGSHAIDRDSDLEVTSSPHKVARRQATADSYRRHPNYAVPDEELLHYLRNGYQIDFGLAA